MQVVYAKEEFPESWTKSIFLVGPTPRKEAPVLSWRHRALEVLEAQGYDGVVFIPEERSGQWQGSYTDQTEWEKSGLKFADRIVAWVPRDLETMPAFTTNIEFGLWVSSGKLILGHPEGAPKTRYLDWLLADEVGGDWHPTLEGTIEAALEGIGDGAKRRGGERYVPLHIWETPMFQEWYKTLLWNGNRLDEADVKWIGTVTDKRILFAWILWVKVWISSEKRHKENEWVFSRKDISTVVLYRPNPSLLDTMVVLVREFRSPCRNDDGLVHELPGGSSVKPDQDPLQIASEEVREETGLRIPADRFTFIGNRQLVATLSSHHAFCYAAPITAEELAEAVEMAENQEIHGVEEDSERTYVEVTTVEDLLSDNRMDWSMMGMLMQALLRRLENGELMR